MNHTKVTPRQLVAIFGLELNGGVDDFFAKIPILGNACFPAQAVRVACVNAQGQVFDLLTAIVDVKFFHDLIAGFGENPCQVVAVSATSGVTNVQGACGVGGDILKQDARVVVLALAVIIGVIDVRNDRGKGGFVKGEVDEPGAGDGDRTDRDIECV